MQAREMMNPREPPLGQAALVRNLLLYIGSLWKKLLLGRIPPGTCLRQIAHALGGYAAGVEISKREKGS